MRSLTAHICSSFLVSCVPRLHNECNIQNFAGEGMGMGRGGMLTHTFCLGDCFLGCVFSLLWVKSPSTSSPMCIDSFAFPPCTHPSKSNLESDPARNSESRVQLLSCNALFSDTHAAQCAAQTSGHLVLLQPSSTRKSSLTFTPLTPGYQCTTDARGDICSRDLMQNNQKQQCSPKKVYF